MIATIKKYFLSCTVFLTLGMISGYISQSGDTIWYQSLFKPSYNPPSWIFAPVWTILYIMLGVIFIKLKNENNTKNLLLFVCLFILNLIWPSLFFYLHRIDLALINLAFIWITTLLVFTKTNNTIRLLLAPYFCWISFALLLNYEIYRLNLISIS